MRPIFVLWVQNLGSILYVFWSFDKVKSPNKRVIGIVVAAAGPPQLASDSELWALFMGTSVGERLYFAFGSKADGLTRIWLLVGATDIKFAVACCFNFTFHLITSLEWGLEVFSRFTT